MLEHLLEGMRLWVPKKEEWEGGRDEGREGGRDGGREGGREKRNKGRITLFLVKEGT
jgi:hypothetical protein